MSGSLRRGVVRDDRNEHPVNGTVKGNASDELRVMRTSGASTPAIRTCTV